MWALISTLGVLAAIAIVAAGAITLSNAYRQRAERGGHKGILEYLRAIPASDRDKQEAVDLTLQGGVACLLGLLFLLVKEERTTGVMQVAVQADGFYHATQIPVGNVAAVADVENRVNYIRSLVASAP